MNYDGKRKHGKFVIRIDLNDNSFATSIQKNYLTLFVQ